MGSVYSTHQRAKKWLELGSEGCAPPARGVQPPPAEGWQQQTDDAPAIPPLPFLPPSLPSRAKDLKTRLGVLLHKPELGHKTGSSSKLQLGSRRR